MGSDLADCCVVVLHVFVVARVVHVTESCIAKVVINNWLNKETYAEGTSCAQVVFGKTLRKRFSDDRIQVV